MLTVIIAAIPIFLLLPAFTNTLRLNEIALPGPDGIKKTLTNRSLPHDDFLTDTDVVTNPDGVVMMPRIHTVNWGKRSFPVLCPQNTFIWGYTVVHDSDRTHSAGINRVDFYCRGLDLTPFHFSEGIRLTTNFNVTYRDVQSNAKKHRFVDESFTCESHNGPLTQILLQYEDMKKPGVADQGVLNFQGICWDERTLPPPRLYRAVAGKYGETKSNGSCQPGYAICGSRSTYHVTRKGSSGSQIKGVADLDFYCCKVPNDVDTCSLEQVYKIVARVDNRNNPNSTRESYRITSRITVTETIRQEQQTTWEKSRSEGYVESFIINNIQEKTDTETNRKFEREQSALGLVQGFFDTISGITGFVADGVGKLIGATPLGQLLNVPSIGKLTGTVGIENAIKLGSEGLKHFFADSDFGKLIQRNDIGAIFADLNSELKPKQLEKTVGFSGFAKTLEHYTRLITPYTPVDFPDEMNSIIGPAVTEFSEMSFRDIMGIYGLSQMYGHEAVNKMLRNGQLASVFQIGILERVSWGQGVGKIVDSENIGKLYNYFALMNIFGPFGFQELVNIDNLVGLDDGSVQSDTVFSKFKIYDTFNETHFMDIVVISSFARLLEADNTLVPKLFKGSAIEDLLGKDGLSTITEDTELQKWQNTLESLASDINSIMLFQSLLGLGSITEKLGNILGSEEFQSSVGSINFQMLIGTAELTSSADLSKLAYFYGLKEIVGIENLRVTEIGPLPVEEVESLLLKPALGTVLGVYTVGQVMPIRSLEKVTGLGPQKLTTLDGSHIVKRGIFDSIFESAKTGFNDFLGGVFPTLLGEQDPANRIKNEIVERIRESLEEQRQRENEEQVMEKQSVQNLVVEEAYKMEQALTVETVENEYVGNALTLVLSPTINCDQYYAVDISSKRTHLTIIVPNHDKCLPTENYVVIDRFDCLSTEKKSNRTFFMEVGTEWEPMGQFRKISSNIKDILSDSDTTAGIRERVQQYSHNITGMNNLELKKILEKDLKVEQVWKEIDAYKGIIEAWQFTYNLLLQLKITCDDVHVYSSVPQRIRFPRVFRCKPKGVWEQLRVDAAGFAPHTGRVGLAKGGKDVNNLSRAHRAVPEVGAQLYRMVKEMQDLFINEETSPTNLEGVKWKTDSSLSRNIAWTYGELTPLLAEFPQGDPERSIYQLHAQCGPIDVAMNKFKVEKKGIVQLIFPMDLLEEGNVIDDECPEHLDC